MSQAATENYLAKFGEIEVQLSVPHSAGRQHRQVAELATEIR